MSGPFDPNLNFAGAGQYEQQYGGPDQPYTGSYPPTIGPPTQFDGVGFWYRPDQAQIVLDHNATIYTGNIGATPATIESAVSVKHRRTRSGCFTCRQRRVKCDETRPTCQRCKKGKRQCEFPQPSSSTKRNSKGELGTTQEHMQSQDAGSDDEHMLDIVEDEGEEEEDEEIEKEAADDGDGHTPSSPQAASLRSTHKGIPASRPHDLSRKQRYRQQRKGSVIQNVGSELQQTAGPHSPDAKTDLRLETLESQSAQRWKHLKPQLQRYLDFQHHQMTHHHYFFKFDPTDFLHNEFIDLALSFEPLLMAVLAFAAYHYTVQQQDGQFRDFWKFYCRSIMLLRRWLEKHSERSEAVILTVLQLATFEEYLGDWANLSSHHVAAHSILNSLYTVDNFLETETSRHIYEWFGRVDIITSLMAGTQTVLDRNWFAAAYDFYKKHYEPDETDISSSLRYFHASLRLLGFDMASVFANAAKSANFREEAEAISQRLETMRLEMQRFHNTSRTVVEMPYSSQKSRENSPDPFDPRIPLFTDELWPLNLLWMDWYGSRQMHIYQTALLSKALSPTESTGAPTSSQQVLPQLPPELEQLSLIQCQIIEAVGRWPRAPAGSAIACHASLALSTVFLPREPKMTMWARRKLATIERLGYTWPPTLRRRLAQLWGIEEVNDWWLPNAEGKSPLLDEIRGVVEERNRENMERGVDDGRADLREMKAIFDRLYIGTKGQHLSISDAGSGSAIGSPSEAESGESSSIGFTSPTTAMAAEFGRAGTTKAKGVIAGINIGQKTSRSLDIERTSGS